MNETEDPREAVVTIEWEYVAASSSSNASAPGGGGGGFGPATPVWLDIDGACGSFTTASEVAVPDGTAVFSVAMQPAWTSAGGAAGGDVLAILNHLHDGGVDLQVTRNGTAVCSGAARYGESPGYIDPMPAGGGGDGMEMTMAGSMDGTGTAAMEGGAMAHISSMGYCTAGLGRTGAGDQWAVTAHYNLTAHPAMLQANGKPVPIMGIAVLFVATAA